ncbi:MAG: CotH kinase family protein [Paracoccaceae bacterium]
MKVSETYSEVPSQKYLSKILSLSRAMKLVTFLFFLTLITCISFLLVLYGARLQQNHTTASVKEMVFDATKTKASVFRNYIASFTADAPQLSLDIKFKGMQALNAARDNALVKGIITNQEQKVSVSASLLVNDKQYDVKISPTGYNLDMIADPQKRAFKVKVKGGDKPFGLSEFKLLPPKARNNLVEWIGHELEKREELVALRYFFVNVKLNGNNWGVYAIEEHFSKELLESNGAREGLIFTVNSSGKVRIFNEKKYSSVPQFRRQANLIRSAFRDIMSNKSRLDIENILDVKKFAIHLAILELMNSDHAVGVNTFLYFNPLTNLVEPITREYNSMRISDGAPTSNKFVSRAILNERELPIFQKLSKNENFNRHFIDSLIRISNPEYLDIFFSEIDEKFEQQKNILYQQYPFYYFPKEFMYLKQKHIRQMLSADLSVTALSQKTKNENISIFFENESFLPIELVDLSSDILTNRDLEIGKIILPGAKHEMVFDRREVGHSLDLKFSYRVSGTKAATRTKPVAPISADKGNFLPQFWISSLDWMEQDPRFLVDHIKKEVKFNVSKLQIKSNIIIPEGYLVVGQKGLTIDLINGASLISRSPVKFKGTPGEPINIKSSDFSGGGLYVSGKSSLTEFSFVRFYQLASPDPAFLGLTASVTIFDANVEFNNCSFIRNRSEDFLNIFQSQYVINETEFKDVFSDAFDSDFSNGTVTNSSFFEVGNDALDFSGSEAFIKNITMEQIGDKGISAGEQSSISGSNISVRKAEIGLTSKDLSQLKLRKIDLDEVRLGIAAFKKKEEFGGASVHVTEYKQNLIELNHLVDFASEITIDNKILTDRVADVESKLYGVTFGKSSK